MLFFLQHGSAGSERSQFNSDFEELCQVSNHPSQSVEGPSVSPRLSWILHPRQPPAIKQRSWTAWYSKTPKNLTALTVQCAEMLSYFLTDSGQFYHGLEFEVTDTFPGKDQGTQDAVMLVKGHELVVTR